MAFNFWKYKFSYIGIVSSTNRVHVRIQRIWSSIIMIIIKYVENFINR